MKNKKIFLIIFAIIIIIAATVGTLYFTTDVFKTEKQLFFENLSKINIGETDLSQKLNELNKKMKSNSNSSKTYINFAMSNPNDETGISEMKNVFGIKTNTLTNKELKQNYSDFTISVSDKDMFTSKIIRDNNTYGILIDNVLTKYISLENKNLKEFFTKLGFEDVSNIPDTIETTTNDLLKIDDTTLNGIIEKYYTLIYNNIDKTHFEKRTNEDKTQNLTLKLAEKEMVALLKKILTSVKDDTTILNLILNQAQISGYEDITIEKIQTKFQKIIEEINEEEYSEENSATIMLTKNKENIIKITVQVDYKEDNISIQENNINEFKIELDISESRKTIIAISYNNVETEKISLTYNYDDEKIVLNLEIDNKYEEIPINSIAVQAQILNYKTDSIKFEEEVYVKCQDEQNYQINLSNEFNIKQDIQIEKLTTENSAKLNDMTSKELNDLFEAIGKRINSLYGKQIESVLPSSSVIEKAKSSQEEFEKAQQEEQAMLEKISTTIRKLNKYTIETLQ